MHVVESYLCQEAAKLASRESDNGQVMAVHVLESATHTQLTQEPLSHSCSFVPSINYSISGVLQMTT